MRNLIAILMIALAFAQCKKEVKKYDATGVFEADEIMVSAEAMGKLLKLNVQEGVELKAGEVVGLIDDANVNLQKAQILASMDALSLKKNDAAPQTGILREQLNTQNKMIATQQEQLKVLEKERSRVQNLVKADAVPAKQLDDIQGQMDILRRQIEATESQMSVLKQQIKSQEEMVSIQNRGILSEKKPLQERVAQMDDQLKKYVVTNPINGVVLTKYMENNEVATIGKPIYKIADMKEMTLRAYVSGNQLGAIKVNQPVKVLIDNGDTQKELSGTITWIANKAEFTPKTIQTKDERANLVYAIKVKVANDGFVKIGMYGEVIF